MYIVIQKFTVCVCSCMVSGRQRRSRVGCLLNYPPNPTQNLVKISVKKIPAKLLGFSLGLIPILPDEEKPLGYWITGFD